MALDKALEKQQINRKQNLPCPFILLRDKLNDKDKATLDKALGTIPDIAIARALQDEGYKMSKDSLGNHRRGICRCARIK